MKHPKHLTQNPLSAFVLFFFLVRLLGLDLEGFPVLRLLRGNSLGCSLGRRCISLQSKVLEMVSLKMETMFIKDLRRMAPQWLGSLQVYQ